MTDTVNTSNVPTCEGRRDKNIIGKKQWPCGTEECSACSYKNGAKKCPGCKRICAAAKLKCEGIKGGCNYHFAVKYPGRLTLRTRNESSPAELATLASKFTIKAVRAAIGGSVLVPSTSATAGSAAAAAASATATGSGATGGASSVNAGSSAAGGHTTTPSFVNPPKACGVIVAYVLQGEEDDDDFTVYCQQFAVAQYKLAQRLKSAEMVVDEEQDGGVEAKGGEIDPHEEEEEDNEDDEDDEEEEPPKKKAASSLSLPAAAKTTTAVQASKGGIPPAAKAAKTKASVPTSKAASTVPPAAAKTKASVPTSKAASTVPPPATAASSASAAAAAAAKPKASLTAGKVAARNGATRVTRANQTHQSVKHVGRAGSKLQSKTKPPTSKQKQGSNRDKK